MTVAMKVLYKEWNSTSTVESDKIMHEQNVTYVMYMAYVTYMTYVTHVT